VNYSHPHVNGVAGGIAIGVEDQVYSYLDFLGHGTAVFAAIQEKARDAECYAVKVYYRALRTEVRFLVEAIDWAIAQKMDHINLSLGTVNESHRQLLESAVKRAGDAGIVLIAAAQIGTSAVLPGNLPGVTGVGLDWSCPRDRFRRSSVEAQPRWLASGYPRMLPGVAPEHNLKGVSFAVANMTGFAAKACQLAKEGSPLTVAEMLERQAESF
jgi:subtilisin family serine protease